MFIHLGSSKTDQLGKGTTIFLARSQGSSVCPVGHLENYLAMRPAMPGQLFIHFDGSPLSRFQFSRVLTKVIAFAGDKQVPIGQITSHSFRIGAATSAALLGFSNEQIQEWGRWKSGCFKGYIRPPVSALTSTYVSTS